MNLSTALSHNTATGPCSVCGRPGRPCARCRLDYYCDRPHQRLHWPKHRRGCGAVELRDGHLVATRDVPAETVVMREVPLVTFPDSPLPGTGPAINRLCLGCSADLSSGPDKGIQCPQCGLPVCDEVCSKDPNHRPECEAFQRAKHKVSKREMAHLSFLHNVAVAALRTALVAREEPRLKNLQCTLNYDEEGLEVLPGAKEWRLAQGLATKTSTDWLRKMVGVTWLSEDELWRAALVNRLRGQSVRDETPERFERTNKPRYWGVLYVGTSLMRHSCVPNTADLPLGEDTTDSHEYVTVTTRPVAAGERLTRAYQCCSWDDDTRARRTLLLSRWGFVCQCERCKDPTERDMYVGSPCCPACAKDGRQAYIIPASDCLQKWKCETCGQEMPVDEVEALTASAARQLERLEARDAGPNEFIAWTRDLVFPKGPLHATHSLVFLALEHVRNDIFIKMAEQESHVTEEDVAGWIDVCWRLVRGLDRLRPGVGESRIVYFLALRRLLLWRLDRARGSRPGGRTVMECMMQSLTVEDGPARNQQLAAVSAGAMKAMKKDVDEVNKEVLRHLFTRDDEAARFQLLNYPYD